MSSPHMNDFSAVGDWTPVRDLTQNTYRYDTPTTESSSCSDSNGSDYSDISDVEDYHLPIPWGPDSQYIFVNQCLCLDDIGYPTRQLPAYAFYTSNENLDYFWDNLNIQDYRPIYMYLINTGFIQSNSIEPMSEIQNSHMMNIINQFVNNYFVN